MQSYGVQFWTQDNRIEPRQIALYRSLEPLEPIRRTEYGVDPEMPSPAFLSASGYSGDGFTLSLRKIEDSSRLFPLLEMAIPGQAHPYDIASTLQGLMRVWAGGKGVRYHVRRWLTDYVNLPHMRYSVGCGIRTHHREWRQRYNNLEDLRRQERNRQRRREREEQERRDPFYRYREHMVGMDIAAAEHFMRSLIESGHVAPGSRMWPEDPPAPESRFVQMVDTQLFGTIPYDEFWRASSAFMQREVREEEVP